MNRKRKLGISIYPFKHSLEENKKYIDIAKKYNFSRMFTSLLEIEVATKDQSLKTIKEICTYAQKQGFEVILDINPDIFEVLKISLPDVTFFKENGVDTIRLDRSFNGLLERDTTYNDYGINIELNASSYSKIIDLILELKPIKDRILASHNFYPQRYSGLDFNHFLKMSKNFKDQGIRTSAFISSQVGETGPWPITEGLPTLEIHRELPITTQAKHLWATGVIDDVMIGNCFASEQELKQLSELNPYKIELEIEVDPKVTEIEKKIAFGYNKHVRRGDINNFVIRSTWPRVMYKDEKIPKRPNKDEQLIAEVYIPNDGYKQYKGELHLIIGKLPNDDRKNYFGKIVKHEEFLLEYIESWTSFTLKDKTK